MKRNLSGFLAVVLAASACAEKSGSGAAVSIPSVQIDCTSAYCKRNLNPTVIVIITSSGCTSPSFGATRSGSTTSINCTVSGGCQGVVSSWIDGSGTSASTLPSGTYSVCAIADYNRDYVDAAVAGDSLGSLDNVAISQATGMQRVNSWSDL